MFTKLLKPVFKVLREKGLLSSAYIDDLYLQGDTFHECHENALNTVQLLRDLGTSCLHPSQQLEYLGFVLNSVSMTVRLSNARVEKVVQACEKLLSNSQPTTLHLAEVIWLMVSSFPAVEHGPLYYRSLDIEKIESLRQTKGNLISLVKYLYLLIQERNCSGGLQTYLFPVKQSHMVKLI